MFKFKYIFLVIIFTCFQSTAWSLATEFHYAKSDGTQAYLYFENKIWHLKLIKFSPSENQKGQWPELINQKSFNDVTLAQSWLKKNNYFESYSLESDSALELSDAETLEDGLWQAENEWNWDAEKKYAEWLQTAVDTNFFKNYKIKTDCADVQYYLRWIFARIFKYPMASRLPGGAFLTHRSIKNEWKNLPTHSEWHKDKRFLAAMSYLTNLVYTHTLYRDSYPIQINKEAASPGAFHLLISGKSGHTMVIYRQDPATDGVRIYVMSSTVPRAVRVLSHHRAMQSNYKENESAIMRMRWPLISGQKVSLWPAEKMPFYSKEQFSFQEGTDINRILNPNPNWKIEYEDAVATVVELLNLRKDVVQKGLEICYPNKCPLDSQQYDDYSTPSRDRRIREVLAYFDEEISGMYNEYDSRMKTESVFELAGESFTLQMIKFAFSEESTSSDPNHSFERRWPFGEKRFLKAHTEQAQDILNERRQKIIKSQNACVAQPLNCKPGSETFKTYSLDSSVYAFQKNYNRITSFSQEFAQSKWLIEHFENLVFSDTVQTFSTKNWNQHLLKASLDPRSPPELKEAQYEAYFTAISIEDGWTTVDSKIKDIVIMSHKNTIDFKFQKVVNQKLVPFNLLDAKEKILRVSTEDKKALVCMSPKCFIYDYDKSLVIYQFSENHILNKQTIEFYNSTLLAYNRNSELPRNNLTDLVVVDLKNDKVVFEQGLLEAQRVSVSPDFKYLSYYKSILNPEDSNDYMGSYWLKNLNDPEQPDIETKVQINFGAEVLDYEIKWPMFYLKSKYEMSVFDLSNPNESYDQRSIYVSSGRQYFTKRRVTDNGPLEFRKGYFDSNTFKFFEEVIPELKNYSEARIYRSDEKLFGLDIEKGITFEFSAENFKQPIHFKKSNEVLVKNVKDFDLWLKFEDRFVIMQVRNSNGKPLTDWLRYSIELYEFAGSPGDFVYRTHSDQWHSYYQEIKNPNFALLNGFFNFFENGIVVTENEIWLKN